MKFLIIIKLFIQIFSYNNKNWIEFQFSNITLRIIGTGTKNIFYEEFVNRPDEVYINGDIQDNVDYSYKFHQENNYVRLVWSNIIDDCNQLFYGCSDITEIDLSDFDTSHVTTMECMFKDCSSLTS